jgi:hypothetical protein
MIYNIVKIEASGTTLCTCPVGYIDSEEDKSTFEGIHGTPFTDWVADNPGEELTTYFDTNDPCYLIDSVTSIQEGLSLITNLENPEA